MIRNSAMTVNEWREQQGLPPFQQDYIMTQPNQRRAPVEHRHHGTVRVLASAEECHHKQNGRLLVPVRN